MYSTSAKCTEQSSVQIRGTLWLVNKHASKSKTVDQSWIFANDDILYKIVCIYFQGFTADFYSRRYINSNSDSYIYLGSVNPQK